MTDLVITLRSEYADISERDPYRHLLIDSPVKCPHGHGDNCSCQLPYYRGLFVAPIERDGVTRHIVCMVQQAHDGGMREFQDPVTGQVVGSCGVNFWYDGKIKPLEGWTP